MSLSSPFFVFLSLCSLVPSPACLCPLNLSSFCSLAFSLPRPSSPHPLFPYSSVPFFPLFLVLSSPGPFVLLFPRPLVPLTLSPCLFSPCPLVFSSPRPLVFLSPHSLIPLSPRSLVLISLFLCPYVLLSLSRLYTSRGLRDALDAGTRAWRFMDVAGVGPCIRNTMSSAYDSVACFLAVYLALLVGSLFSTLHLPVLVSRSLAAAILYI